MQKSLRHSKISDIQFLTANQIEQMHGTLTGCVHTASRRSELESAAGLPMQTWGGEFLYPTLYIMAAAMLRSLAENQPFTDGNKRIAWVSAIVFLDINGVTIEA